MKFPKPTRKEKVRKRMKRTPLNKVSPAGKKKYSERQRALRAKQDMQYRKYIRPTYLLDLARRQKRLRRELPPGVPQDQFGDLEVGERPVCEVRVACEGSVATQVHHRKGRGKAGDHHLLNEPKYFAASCNACHDHIEQNRAWAYNEGWLLKRNQKD